MPLAKDSGVNVRNSPEVTPYNNAPLTSTMSQNGDSFPKKFLDYFGLDYSRDVEYKPDTQRELKTIWEHSKGSISDIDKLARHLGAPKLNERTHTRLFNYISLSNKIKALEEERNVYGKAPKIAKPKPKVITRVVKKVVYKPVYKPVYMNYGGI